MRNETEQRLQKHEDEDGQSKLMMQVALVAAELRAGILSADCGHAESKDESDECDCQAIECYMQAEPAW